MKTETVKTIFLHLAPGCAAALAFAAIGPLFAARGLPVELAMLPIVAVCVLAAEAWYIHRIGAWRTPLEDGQQGAPNTRTKWIVGLGCTVWAAACFMILGALVGKPLKELWAPYFPEAFAQLGSYVHGPIQYSRTIRIISWCAMLLVSGLAAPIIEELYFRRALFTRMTDWGFLAPLASAVLFALYHAWAPWLIPVRIAAVLPYVFAAWKFGDVRIAIGVHMALNLVGDVVLIAPLVFAP